MDIDRLLFCFLNISCIIGGVIEDGGCTFGGDGEGSGVGRQVVPSRLYSVRVERGRRDCRWL